MSVLISFVGLLCMMLLAWSMSENRRKMDWRVIIVGVSLQFGFALLILKILPDGRFFEGARALVTRLLACSNEGAEFLFGKSLTSGENLAFVMLSTIVFFSSLSTVLFHLGVIQFLVRIMAWIMVRLMRVSGAESLCVATNVFVGMTEAPLVIRPYMTSMTRSEIMAMLTGGLATISGGMMALYTAMGADAGHLLAASIMSAPASLVIAKIMIPETEESQTLGIVKVQLPRQDRNLIDAACRGASDGLKLALNVGAMLIAFVGLIAFVNWTLGSAHAWTAAWVGGREAAAQAATDPLTLEKCLGWLMAPVAWMMGIEWADATTVGMLLGKKTILNEFLAYQDLVAMKDQMSERSFIIATYALCGFANFGSVAIMIGGIGGLAPERRREFAELGIRALIGGSLAAFMTATIAGMLI